MEEEDEEEEETRGPALTSEELKQISAEEKRRKEALKRVWIDKYKQKLRRAERKEIPQNLLRVNLEVGYPHKPIPTDMMANQLCKMIRLRKEQVWIIDRGPYNMVIWLSDESDIEDYLTEESFNLTEDGKVIVKWIRPEGMREVMVMVKGIGLKIRGTI